jgi:integrase
MPKPRTISELIHCRYYTWRIFQDADGTWQGDGRSNPTRRRPTLGNGTREEAIAQLHLFDQLTAVENGFAPRAVLLDAQPSPLSIQEAFDRYLDDVRSKAATGEAVGAHRRYGPIAAKFVRYCGQRHYQLMTAVTDRVVRDYLGWMDEQGYEHGTKYTELTVIKQMIKFVISEGLLPESARLRVTMPKPTESSTYCYTDDDIARILGRCLQIPQLQWLFAIFQTLAFTGIRIGELRQLRWDDIDFDADTVTVTEERFGGRRRQGAAPRAVKGKRSRTISLFPSLKKTLLELKKRSPHVDGVVFRTPNGALIKPDRLRRILVRDILRPLAEDSDDGRQILQGRLHSFRHYFCSSCAKNPKVTQRMLMDMLGHRSDRMTARYYTMDRTHARAAMASVAFPEPVNS